MDGHDIRVLQSSGGFRFLVKTAECFRAGEFTGKNQLQRHLAVEAKLLCPVHDSHSAASDFL
jgi:hypothetical protein